MHVLLTFPPVAASYSLALHAAEAHSPRSCGHLDYQPMAGLSVRETGKLVVVLSAAASCVAGCAIERLVWMATLAKRG